MEKSHKDLGVGDSSMKTVASTPQIDVRKPVMEAQESTDSVNSEANSSSCDTVNKKSLIDNKDATFGHCENISPEILKNETVAPQKAVSPTIFENAVKVVKNLFSPVKGHGIFSISQPQINNNNNHNNEVIVKKILENTDNMDSKGNFNGLDRVLTTGDKLSILENTHGANEDVNDSSLRNCSNNGDPHDNTNDSYTTSLSLMDESFQSTVTHFEDCATVEESKINDNVPRSDEIHAFNCSFNETLGLNDNSLDNTLQKNLSICSSENDNVNRTYEANIEDRISDNIIVDEETVQFHTIQTDLISRNRNEWKNENTCMISPSLTVQGVPVRREALIFESQQEKNGNPLHRNQVNSENANDLKIYSAAGSVDNSLFNAITANFKQFEDNDMENVYDSIQTSVQRLVIADEECLNPLPATNQSSGTDCSLDTGRSEDAVSDKCNTNSHSWNLEKNFSTSTIIISKENVDVTDLQNINEELPMKHCVSPTLNAPKEVEILDHTSCGNEDNVINDKIYTCDSMGMNHFNRNVEENNGDFNSLEISISPVNKILNDSTSCHLANDIVENFHLNVADLLSKIDSDTEHEIFNQPSNNNQNVAKLGSLSEAIHYDHKIPLATQKSYTLLHSINQDLNRPVVQGFESDIKSSHFNSMLLENSLPSDLNTISGGVDFNDTIVGNSKNQIEVSKNDLPGNIPNLSAGNCHEIGSCNISAINIDESVQNSNAFEHNMHSSGAIDMSLTNNGILDDFDGILDEESITKNSLYEQNTKLIINGNYPEVRSPVIEMSQKSAYSDSGKSFMGSAELFGDSRKCAPNSKGNKEVILNVKQDTSTFEQLSVMDSELRELNKEVTLGMETDCKIEIPSDSETCNKTEDSSCKEVEYAADSKDDNNDINLTESKNYPSSDADTLATENDTDKISNYCKPNLTEKDIKKFVNNLNVDFEKLKITDISKEIKSEVNGAVNFEADLGFQTLGKGNDSLASGDDSHTENGEDKIMSVQPLGNDNELNDLIREQFTVVDIETICSVVDDLPELNLSKNIVMASQQFDKSFNDKVLNEVNSSKSESFIVNNENCLSTACLDFLDSIKGKPSGRDYSRESLYVKFDPLVQSKFNTGLLDISEGDKENLIISPVSKINATTDALIPITPLNKAGSSPLSAKTPISQKNESRLFTEKANKLRELQSEMIRLREFYLQREQINKEKLSSYENEIAKLTGRACVLEDKLKESEEREKSLVKKLHMHNDSMNRIKRIMDECLAYIAKLTDQFEAARIDRQKQISVLKEERDYYMKHLQSTEQAFSDVHSKYEKCKKALEILKKNEESYRINVESLKMRIEQYPEKISSIQENAAKEINTLYDKINDMKAKHTQEVSRFKAQLKKTELKVQSMQEALNHKIKENQELAGICDELIQGKK